MTAPELDDHDELDTLFFATDNAENSESQYAKMIREGQYGLFGFYAEDEYAFASESDIDIEVARMQQATGMGRRAIQDAISSYMRLQDLPHLRAMQRETRRLDLSRLRAIDVQLSKFGAKVPEEILAFFDEYLTTLFTPTKINQQLPTPRQLHDRLRKIIAEMDCSVDCDDKKKADRKNNTAPGDTSVVFCNERNGDGTATLEINTDNATMAAIKASIDATAREHGLSLSDATVKLLSGDVTPSPKAVIYAYSNTSDDVSSYFIPGFGWTTAPGTEVLDQIAASESTTVTDLDSDAATAQVDGYVAPERVKAYVRARDGTCIWPGCSVSAWNCQLDHRVPYGQGGKTEAANLFCLCAHHHNCKTDRTAFYIPDPVSKEIVWLFADGSYARVDNNGFLHEQTTPVAPKWSISLPDWKRLKRHRAQFFAKCHTVMDEYEEDSDYDKCVAALNDLEEEFKLEFPYHPVPLPTEPDPEFEPPPED